MDSTTRDLLHRLLDAPAPSGFEAAAARAWRSEAEAFADEVWGDVYGSAFARIGSGGAPRVMVAGHIDEIGLMVHHVDDDGYLYVKPVGGWDPQVLVGQRVEIVGDGDAVVGVVGRRAVHLLKDDKEREKAVKVRDLWVDIGARDAEEARDRVEIGDVAVIRSDTVAVGRDRIAARSIDDRIGALIALEAVRRAASGGVRAEVVAVATTQEEIGYASGGGGARSSSFGLEPDAALVVDVCHATDHPKLEREEHGDIRLGEGPVLARGAVVNQTVYRRLTEAAEDAGVPVQVAASPSRTGTDADSIFTNRSGIATGLVSIPNRYMHSPNQLVDTGDVEHAVDLIAAFLAALEPGMDFRPH